MSWSIETLSWLPEVGEGFRQNLGQVRELEPDERVAALCALARHRLDVNQLTRLGRAVGAERRAGLFPGGLAGLTLGVISNGITDLLAPCLVATGLRYGLAIDVVCGGFGQLMQEALDPDSTVRSASPDVVLLALDHRGLPFAPQLHGNSGADDAMDFVRALRRGLSTEGAVCLFQTVSTPPGGLLGNMDIAVRGTLAAQVARFNRCLVDELAGSTDAVLDVAGLAHTVGAERWHDAARWHLAKMPFPDRFLPLYAEHVVRMLAAMRGKSRKCLVLDLDNTLWGGVIGDDGVEGIVVGQGNPTGEAYLAVQRMALGLKERGIVLAVCSKNDESIAREPFRSHPDMLMKERDIAVFLANWRDKAGNLREIARRLNIGLDALVLLDDNPVERAQVREGCPEVAVVEVPDDPSLFSRAVLASGLFESVRFTAEDRERSEQYAANSERESLRSAAGNLDEFLSSLGMEACLTPFDDLGRARIAQLINKTNQFNLTTRRYSEAEVRAMETDPTAFTLQVRLADRFGDNGMISVVICRIGADEWVIDTWLMSCRVINRRLEEAVCDHLVECARQAGAHRLVGHYVPTERNALVRDHYAKLGFIAQPTSETGERWVLDLSGYHALRPPIKVVVHLPADV